MNNNIYEIIALLADGKSRSGQEIGDLLNITRSAVWKIMHKLSELGIPVERHQGKGYRFTRPVQMLDKDLIWSSLSPEAQKLIPQFDLVDTLDSTNNYMLQKLKQAKPSGSLVISEHQTAGRGRLGRTWHSPYAANIYLALYWHFDRDTTEISGLSQVITTSVVTALEQNNVTGLCLKWPNDIYHNDKKLAGVLVDMIAESHSATDTVIGVSLNISMHTKDDVIDQPWTDIHTITDRFPDRNKITSTLLDSIYSDIQVFAQKGFEPFAKRWSENDCLANNAIIASNGQQTIEGIARGVGSFGELLIETSEGIVPFLNGSVKIRNNEKG
ncbi:MAG: bifunctional biotin--[acetyl-CoA-carboxylase] ligase/biotin operon repressor BirA [Gammaproteobacteria bacterium]|nr:bifunctional biotin--[acetyl-CoA-carboxylase] ligase/biotin operon repressor BirA [Gammaproteobacteria bacterium]